MEFLVYFIGVVLIVFSILTIINVLTFPRLRIARALQDEPHVSILIPARNEAHIIGRTVSAILAQSYPNFELIVLNDNSTDATDKQLKSIVDTRLKVIHGSPLADGWMGKSWACHQLSQKAKGDILIFTDADVQWTPNALTVIIAQMQQHNADLFTVWSTQQTLTLAERLTVPLIAFAILSYLPTVMTHYSRLSIFAAANGQCMAWKRAVYHQIGGHIAVASTVLDDVHLARIVKKAGYKLRMTDGNQLITCRMYDSWQTVRDGFAKNILAGYGDSVLALSLSIIFHFVVFLFPFILLVISPEYRLWAGIFIVQAILIRALSAVFTHQRLVDAIGMSFSVLLMTIIAIRSIRWHYSGGPRWKGRILNNRPVQEGQINA